jgi:hypothetical protein
MNSNKTVTAIFEAVTSSPPNIVGASISSITSTSAVANVTVNPNGSSTRVYLQWGTTTAYGYTSTSQLIGSGTADVSSSIPLSGLAPDTTYYSQAVAESSAGAKTLAIAAFKTATGTVSLPDLTVVSLKSVNTGAAGGQIPIELEIKNVGSADAGTFRAGFYLSTDDVINIQDTYTGWVCNYDSGLKAGSSGTCSGWIGIPATVLPGTYKLGVIAVDVGDLNESDKQNNTGTADTGPVVITAAGGDQSHANILISNGGAASVSTLGTSQQVETGYATVDVTSGVAPYGIAVFSFSQGGIVVSEAGVPASPPTNQARIFIDHRPTVVVGGSIIGVSTGIAIANQGTVSANLSFQFKDFHGALLAPTAYGTIAAGAHVARFIYELNRIAPDFVFPSAFSGFGSLNITSDQPISIVALRLTNNQRNDMLLTTIPVADLAVSPGYQTAYLPQVADGGGYRTLITLLNTSDSVETGRVAFFDNNGLLLNITAEGSSSSSSVYPYSISPGSIFMIQTDGSPTSANTGSAQLIPDSGNLAPVGAAIFSYSSGGVLVTESGVPATVATTHARVYVDRSNGHDTGVAIASIGSATHVSLGAYQLDGVTPAGTGIVDLNANGHDARFAYQLISGLPDGFTGVLDISSSQPFAAVTVRSLLNSRNDFLITMFPIADFSQQAPSPVIFPQIADGGGYKTEFIFLSTGGRIISTIKLFDDDGKPLSVGTTSQNGSGSALRFMLR